MLDPLSSVGVAEVVVVPLEVGGSNDLGATNPGAVVVVVVVVVVGGTSDMVLSKLASSYSCTSCSWDSETPLGGTMASVKLSTSISDLFSAFGAALLLSCL